MKLNFTLVLLCLSITGAGCIHIESNEPPNYQVLRESRPVGNITEMDVDVKLDYGKFEVLPASGGELFNMALEYDQNRSQPEFSFEEFGERARIRLDMEDRNIRFGGNDRGNDLVLRLNEAVPANLDITTGVSDAHLDMTGLPVRRFDLTAGVGRTEVAFDRPATEPIQTFDVQCGVGSLTIRGLGNARVARFSMKGGVGKTDIDFTGDLGDSRADAEIEVGVGQVHLTVSRDVGIEIIADGSFLSNISAPSFERNGNVYSHAAPDGSGTKIFIRVRSGIGGVTVELV